MPRWLDLIKQCFDVNDTRNYNELMNKISEAQAERDELSDWQAATIDRLHEIDQLISERKYKPAREMIARSIPGTAQ